MGLRKNTTLLSTLVAKADALDATVASKSAQAAALSEQASIAAAKAQVAADHRAAVGQAFDILDRAGVNI
jgi:hypothetical protein